MSEHEKELLRNVQTHDFAESLRLRRAKEARESGLPERAFALPFPANQTVHMHRSDRWLWPFLLAASGLVASACGALWRQPQASGEPAAIEFQVWTEDGGASWQTLPVPSGR